MKKNVKLKVGDRVYAITNNYWGLAPMTITENKGVKFGFYCSHPYYGRGLFFEDELVKFSHEREKLINNLVKLKQLVLDMEKDIFQL